MLSATFLTEKGCHAACFQTIDSMEAGAVQLSLSYHGRSFGESEYKWRESPMALTGAYLRYKLSAIEAC